MFGNNPTIVVPQLSMVLKRNKSLRVTGVSAEVSTMLVGLGFALTPSKSLTTDICADKRGCGEDMVFHSGDHLPFAGARMQVNVRI